MTTPAILTQNLTKRFAEFTAVDSLNFRVAKGEIFGLVGPDGAGKTTVMRILAGILDYTSGNVEVLGLPLAKNAEKIKESIGYMSQRFGLYPDLSVAENMEFYADIYTVLMRDRPEIEEKLLHFSGLKPFVKRLASALSGGMKQKLGLACALVHSPALVLLDEPTNGVDPVSRRDFWKILKGLQAEGMTILITTSYLDEAEKCDRIGLMNEGKIILSGTPEELSQQFPGQLLEIIPANAREQIHQYQEAFGKNNARLFGNKIHLYLAKEENIEEVKRYCLSKNSKVQSISPSLEDIFIEAVSR